MQYKSIFNISVKRTALLVVFILVGIQGFSQVTGLNNFKLFIDPGHEGTENMGLYNYSEAQKVLRVGLEVKQLFEEQTDINQVYISRLTDADKITLSERTDLANSLGADFYYSIHSDAGSPTANSTLTMYGGYRNNGVTIEKIPNGGAAFGAILIDDLTGVMRIGTRGNYADRVYYLGPEDTHTNQWPYLHVNRTTDMASLLSEAGFHTNPRQQQLNINTEWKKMEALSAFRSILEYKGVSRPQIGVVAGIITDADTGEPINGVQVSIGEQVYTTDTYTSVFNAYSSDPNQLKNGFYWIEGLTPGSAVQVDYTSDEYLPKSENLNVSSDPEGRTYQNITFADVVLTNTKPSVVQSVNVDGGLDNVVLGRDIYVVFSRKMDKASVEQAVSILPAANLTYTWADDFTIKILPQDLTFETAYVLKIDGGVAKNSLTNQFLDGDADGNDGGDYSVNLTTSVEDLDAPIVMQKWPSADEPSNEIRPVIRVVFDEELLVSSLGADAIVVTEAGDDSPLSGLIDHTLVNKQSVLHFFLNQDLENDKSYSLTIKGDITDIYGNAFEEMSYNFDVMEQKIMEQTLIDGFDDGIVEWWTPQASGSTSGIVTEQTSRALETSVVVKSIASAGSMRFDYGWQVPGTGYIREYLPPNSDQNQNKFNTAHVLQMFVFGDGSNNRFRFMIKDGSAKYEGSDWYTVDWMGWKLISWDLTTGQSNAWVNGDGVLDGTDFFLDGIHLSSAAGAKSMGTLYFDDLRFVVRNEYNATSVDMDLSSDAIQVYPNPVKEMLYIKSERNIKQLNMFNLSGNSVMLKNTQGFQESLNVDKLPNGLYVLKVSTDSGVTTVKVHIRR